jgi:hypothetical protein
MDEKKGVSNGTKRCVKCNSKFTYVRIKDQERVCRSCGHIEKLENQE